LLLRRGNELLRVPAHQVVFLGRNKINLEIALIGVGFELVDVVDNSTPRDKNRRGNNALAAELNLPIGI